MFQTTIQWARGFKSSLYSTGLGSGFFAILLGILPHLALANSGANESSVVPILDSSAIDNTVKPCDNFYQYACGKWLKEFPLPGDKSSYWHQSGALEEQTVKRLNQIFTAYAAGDFSVPSKYAKKIGSYYASCMNESQMAANSAAPLKAQRALVNQIKSFDDLTRVTAALHRSGVSALFGFYGAQDYEDSTRVIGHTGQGGLSLPEKDYYFKTDEKSLEIIRKFKAHIGRVFVLNGFNPKLANSYAETVFGIEKKLAEHAYALADLYDTSKLNHPVTLAEMQALIPELKWPLYFKALGAPTEMALNAQEPEFLKGLSAILRSQSLKQIKIYLWWSLLHAHASVSSPELELESFNFWKKELNGQKEPAPRWKRCTYRVNDALSEAVGEAYIGFIDQAETIRTRAREMVEEIKTQFGINLVNLAWLDDSTRTAAQSKLKKVNHKIGFPDRWRSYDELQVSASDMFANEVQSSEFETRRNLAKIGKPVDRAEWSMAAWEANAYYDPSLNEMVFPLGELVPPIFDLSASAGANYGALGATMGHELIHGFDTNGSQIDGDGNLKNWWSESTQKDFEARTQCLIKQADKYEILPGLFVKGEMTITENIADQGGTKVAYGAYKRVTTGQPPAPLFLGMNEDQQFFLSYAQSWCAKRTPENLRNQVLSNEHAPEEFRVNGILFNMPEFAEAFGCAKGSPMAPIESCHAW